MNADKINFKNALNRGVRVLEISYALSFLSFDFHRRLSAFIGG